MSKLQGKSTESTEKQEIGSEQSVAGAAVDSHFSHLTHDELKSLHDGSWYGGEAIVALFTFHNPEIDSCELLTTKEKLDIELKQIVEKPSGTYALILGVNSINGEFTNQPNHWVGLVINTNEPR